jgi:hypothetical protein
MPAALRDFAEHQPFTPIIETMRGLWMGQTSTGVPQTRSEGGVQPCLLPPQCLVPFVGLVRQDSACHGCVQGEQGFRVDRSWYGNRYGIKEGDGHSR